MQVKTIKKPLNLEKKQKKTYPFPWSQIDISPKSLVFHKSFPFLTHPRNTVKKIIWQCDKTQNKGKRT